MRDCSLEFAQNSCSKNNSLGNERENFHSTAPSGDDESDVQRECLFLEKADFSNADDALYQHISEDNNIANDSEDSGSPIFNFAENSGFEIIINESDLEVCQFTSDPSKEQFYSKDGLDISDVKSMIYNQSSTSEEQSDESGSVATSLYEPEEQKKPSKVPKASKVSKASKASKASKVSKASKASKASKVSKDLEMNQSSPDYSLSKQFERGLDGDFSLTSKPLSEDPDQRRRGRPETIKDLSAEKLNSLFDESIRDLDRKLSDKPDQRSDAKTATINRHVKKFCDKFLKHIGSKCKYKSKSIEDVVQSYLKAFCLGFCPFFDIICRDEKRGYFFDFIVLCFPEQKVKCIFDMLHKEGYITLKAAKGYIDQLTKRKAAQKKSFQQLYKDNSCFQRIVKTVLDSLKNERNKIAIKSTLTALSF